MYGFRLTICLIITGSLAVIFAVTCYTVINASKVIINLSGAFRILLMCQTHADSHKQYFSKHYRPLQ